MRARDIADFVRSVAATPEPRKGSDSPRLDETEFKRRFRSQFQDGAFEPLQAELGRVADAAWDAYLHERKSPKTRKAGPGYADPDYDLAVDWVAAKERIEAAQMRHDDPAGPIRVLLINGSSRSEAGAAVSPYDILTWIRASAPASRHWQRSDQHHRLPTNCPCWWTQRFHLAGSLPGLHCPEYA